MTNKWFVAALLLILFSVLSHADDGSNDPRAFFKRALNAHEEKDYANFVKNMEVALRLRPRHQIYMYDLAAAYALAGNKSAALALLLEAAEMGLIYPKMEQDADFASLRGSTEFEATLKRLAENQKPIIHSDTALTIPEKGLVPEGLAYDPNTKTFYLGSVYRRKIVSINEAQEREDFSRETDGLWSVMGMKVDAQRRLLWVCTSGHAQMANAKKEDDGKSAIFKYDLKTGRLLKRYPVPANGQKHWLGDLTLDSRGRVYASDSVSPAIYRISDAKDELELFCANAAFINPQGLAFTSDENHLLMADYLKGLFLIDLKTKAIIDLAVPPHSTLLGIDGIYAVRDGVLAVQNGVAPNRVLRIRLGDDWRKIENIAVIESNNPLFDEPTLGVTVGDYFYLVANSQWGAIDEHGGLAPPDKLREAIILRIKL